MTKRLLLLMSVLSFSLLVGSVNQTCGQSRKSVSAAEVNGTFRSYFSGKFKNSYSEIKILALGRGKLKVSFELLYPHLDGEGEVSSNVGETEGEATIEGDTAVYPSNEDESCRITIKFVRPGTIRVSQKGSDADCGFGHNVRADGIFKKVSNAKPKF